VHPFGGAFRKSYLRIQSARFEVPTAGLRQQITVTEADSDRRMPVSEKPARTSTVHKSDYSHPVTTLARASETASCTSDGFFDNFKVASLSTFAFEAALVDAVLVELGDGDDRLDIGSDGRPFNLDIHTIDDGGRDRILGSRIEVKGSVLSQKKGPGSGFVTLDDSLLQSVLFQAVTDLPGLRLDVGFARTTVMGNVAVRGGDGLGGNGLTSFRAVDSRLHGALRVNSVRRRVGTELIRTQTFGRITIRGNDSDDWIVVEDSHVHGSLTMNLLNGNDIVSVSGNSNFDRLVLILFGGGNDVLRTFDVKKQVEAVRFLAERYGLAKITRICIYMDMGRPKPELLTLKHLATSQPNWRGPPQRCESEWRRRALYRELLPPNAWLGEGRKFHPCPSKGPRRRAQNVGITTGRTEARSLFRGRRGRKRGSEILSIHPCPFRRKLGRGIPE